MQLQEVIWLLPKPRNDTVWYLVSWLWLRDLSYATLENSLSSPKGQQSWRNKSKGEFLLASSTVIAEQLQSWTMVIPLVHRNGSKHWFQALYNSRNNCDLTEVGLILIGIEAACKVIVLKNIINYCHCTARSSSHNFFLELESFYKLV